MKALLLTASLLAYFVVSVHAQSPTPTEAQLHSAVQAFLKKTLANPSSYESVSWGEPKPETQQSEDYDKAADEMEAFIKGVKQGKASDNHVAAMEAAGASTKDLIAANHKSMAIMAAADAHKKRADSLMASTDTHVLGTGIMHAYKAKNGAGEAVTTRAFFVMLLSGQIRVIKQ